MLAASILDNRPLISIIIAWKLNVQELIVLVDTGFTGELKITPQLAKELGIQVTDVRTVNMGDGRSVVCSSGLAYVSLEGIKKEISVLISEGQPVIGVALLKRFNYKFIADFSCDEFILQRKDENLFD